MKNKIIFFINLIYYIKALFFSPTTYTNPNNNIYYDFTSLQRPYNSPYNLTYNQNNIFKYTYLFNFGINTNFDCEGKYSNTLEILNFLGKNYCEILGKKENYRIGLIDEKNPNGGIYIEYYNGEYCYKEDDKQNYENLRKTRFNIYCDYNIEDIIFEIDMKEKEIGNLCNLKFKIKNKAGCPKGINYRKQYLGLVIIWCIIIINLYILIAIIYNIKIKKKKGWEAFPNLKFWERIRKKNIL